MKTQRKRRKFNQEFKLQMVQLYNNGKSRQDIITEYDLTPSSLDRWIKQYNNSGSFNHSDNLTDEQKEIIKLKKQLKEKEIENDILKQAALIMGQK